MTKQRLDLKLVEEGRFHSRERARAAIMAGAVSVNGRLADKPGMPVAPGDQIEIRENTCPFVSRGGLKLQKALDCFALDVTDFFAMDIGASTGGFTDCLLQRGAQKVCAVDVGYGQLDYRLRCDPRVVVRERTNIRYLNPATVPEPLDLVTVDVSFISVRLVYPVAALLLKPAGFLISLVKPQFEAGREQVGKGGIVRCPNIHIAVIEQVAEYGRQARLTPTNLTFSPITGAKGNIEYLMLFQKQPTDETSPIDTPQNFNIAEVVREAHREMDGKRS